MSLSVHFWPLRVNQEAGVQTTRLTAVVDSGLCHGQLLTAYWNPTPPNKVNHPVSYSNSVCRVSARCVCVCGQSEQDTPGETGMKDTKSAKSMMCLLSTLHFNTWKDLTLIAKLQLLLSKSVTSTDCS